MALLSNALTDKDFDIRMVARGLSKGYIQQVEVDKHLKKLPDDAANAEYINLEVLLEGVGGKSGLRD